MLKKGDIENAALTNASKDSETVSDTTIDNMLNQLNLDRNSSKDLSIVEGLVDQKNNETTKEKLMRHKPRARMPVKKVHSNKSKNKRKKR